MERRNLRGRCDLSLLAGVFFSGVLCAMTVPGVKKSMMERFCELCNGCVLAILEDVRISADEDRRGPLILVLGDGGFDFDLGMSKLCDPSELRSVLIPCRRVWAPAAAVPGDKRARSAF